MECKRFGKGSIYEDMECMLCEKQGQCNSIARKVEKEKRVSEAHNDCKNCIEILHCKGYKLGLRCSSFTCNLSPGDSYGYYGCDECSCLGSCIKKYCKDVKYICKKDITYKRFFINETFIKGNEYTFKVFENNVIYQRSLLTMKDSEIFNRYFEEVK